MKMNYEDAYKELEEIIASLENESLSLMDLPNKVKRAGELIKFCKDQLRGIEYDLTQILYDEEE